jgi:hypothetical protein
MGLLIAVTPLICVSINMIKTIAF